jgi:ligand-binding sensor protein
MSELSQDFEQKCYGVENCPKSYGTDGLCMGRDPACARKPKDWDHCPAFLEVRKDRCPCYNSDLALTVRVQEAVREAVRRGEVPGERVRHECHAGFCEVAFPIIVHDQLVGVAMTGQVFSRPDQIKPAHEFVRSKRVNGVSVAWETQKGKEELLEEVRQILIGTELDRRRTGEHTAFLVNEAQLKEKVDCLLPNLERFQKSAEAHYRDFRIRSECAFRQELLGFVANHKADENFFEEHIKYVLQRMQSFWAFKASYLLHYSFDQKMISLVASSVLGKAVAFGLPGRYGQELSIPLTDFHPCPYLHSRDATPHSVSAPLNNATRVIESIIDKSNGTELKVTHSNCEFFVVLPTVRGVYTFVLVARDPAEVSGLECLSPGSVSDLTQDLVFETCGEIVGEFQNLSVFNWADMEAQVRRLEKLKEEVAANVQNVGVQVDAEIEETLGREHITNSKIREIVSEAVAKIVDASTRSVAQRIVEIGPRPRKPQTKSVRGRQP